MEYRGTKSAKQIMEPCILKDFAVSPSKPYHHFTFGYHSISLPESYGDIDAARKRAMEIAYEENWI